MCVCVCRGETIEKVKLVYVCVGARVWSGVCVYVCVR